MRKKAILLILATLIVGTAGIYQYPKTRWRADLCVSKVAGKLPMVTWGDLAAAALPRRFANALSLAALSVTAEQRGRNPCPVLWKTGLGSFWGRSTDEWPLRLALKNLLMEDLYFHVRAGIEPGDIVLDGGSHLGTFTRFALDQNARLVVAFDPDAVNGAGFRKTFQKEISDGRVILFEQALWARTGRLSFSSGGSSVSGTVSQSEVDQHDESQVPATTIDKVVEQLHLNRVDFIKLHIEGSERQALAGAHDTVVRFNPNILVALDHRVDDPDVIPRMILGMGPSYRVQMRGREQACFFMHDD
jgi:FkbM family methyltransferase